ncbi:MAG TPA: (deoxy)nucleoside triphosphate pyrophosphohydrolase [Syntrophales bacterium]|nr:(deoxy)nucleoside triphosphate pyrophosphohydrolase [Syntrophales bacterium]HOX94748.1 (deoxy)nucleoside triphosphate pyrophosphohydrolase [Syntrophales bacterium]HPI56030.1 (deoxy)nucleoside triphosphate pyrophosphohydrolase [Syntrophales bacterium]HPN24080.1 (deoxy)nucleoside triphosphate pyrophosphohydrolase [Syntrophales bacterium]HQM28359.1 (deoxy)nucleoside triphosphate pyrophosphohydrolase [Syntrophales bacterium]
MRIVTAAVIEREGKILVARRKKGDRMEGLWEFPGGKLEGSESPEECLKRELHEEFGIEAEIGEFLLSSPYEYPHLKIELLAYRAIYVSGDFKLNDHDEIRWVLPSELRDYNLAGADVPVADILMKGSPFTK